MGEWVSDERNVDLLRLCMCCNEFKEQGNGDDAGCWNKVMSWRVGGSESDGLGELV